MNERILATARDLLFYARDAITAGDAALAETLTTVSQTLIELVMKDLNK